MEVKIRNFTQEYETLKRQVELSETIEDMSYSYVQIDNNNPLFAIAKYIDVLLKPIAEMKFTNNGENTWRSIYNTCNSSFLYTDVIIQNLYMYSTKEEKDVGIQRFIIRDISTGKAQIILCVDVWKNGCEIVERTDSPEFISHVCHDWKNIKKQTEITLEKLIQEKSKEISKKSDSNLYYVEQIRNFEI